MGRAEQTRAGQWLPLIGTILQLNVLEINLITLTQISTNYHKLYIHHMSSKPPVGLTLKKQCK